MDTFFSDSRFCHFPARARYITRHTLSKEGVSVYCLYSLDPRQLPVFNVGASYFSAFNIEKLGVAWG